MSDNKPYWHWQWYAFQVLMSVLFVNTLMWVGGTTFAEGWPTTVGVAIGTVIGRRLLVGFIARGEAA